ncbi:MAG TPA: SDR family NAD(P)-dependent oxidoreductase [Nocardioides sp.]|uniref:SDR family NAD(P)-dependent oxidoreductase n=1 Tax=uncultured Nocardioides sp. TaxID=198441 RepID=UPI000EC3EB15|nr:SDR family NAD(P)-dependent oxidoreductase [uncultured Nocardioides sp.]HCB03841.1 oxidoreductase [Nocardioides sp.]HRI94932.1 SDR family NAD(P)-dependent oxidoreductase [Nocardioides sp.]
MDDRPLSGQVALVSGASRGLGRATAVELAAAGAYVVCTGRSTREHATQTAVDDLTLEGTLDAVRAAGGTGETQRCDHTEPTEVEAMLRDVLHRHGHLDVLVNNAWGGHDHHEEPDGEEVWDEPMEQFRAMLLGGAYSDFVTSMLALRLDMGPAQRGLILTTTWHTPEPPAWVPYESSKAAKNRLVYALGYHLQDRRVPVIAVAPGWMRTELMLTHHTEEELAGRTETPHLAGRVIAAIAADPDALRFTGQVVDVGELAEHYGIDDLDGTRPQGNAGRYLPSPVPPPKPDAG